MAGRILPIEASREDRRLRGHTHSLSLSKLVLHIWYSLMIQTPFCLTLPTSSLDNTPIRSSILYLMTRNKHTTPIIQWRQPDQSNIFPIRLSVLLYHALVLGFRVSQPPTSWPSSSESNKSTLPLPLPLRCPCPFLCSCDNGCACDGGARRAATIGRPSPPVMPGKPTAPMGGVPDALIPNAFTAGFGDGTGFLVDVNVCPDGNVIPDGPAVPARVGNGGRNSPSSMGL